MTISGFHHSSRHPRSTGRRRMTVLVLCALTPLLAVLAASPASACETPDVTVVATAPSATAPTCSADGALVIPTVTGVTYRSTPRGTGPNTYTVAAEAKEGYQLSGTHHWTITVLPRLTGEQCLTKVEPIAPTVQVSTCDGPSSTVPDGTITIPSQQGVDYYVDGAKILTATIPIAPGTSRTVTAVAQDGYGLTGTTSWTLSNPALSCLVTVTPVDPTVVASTMCDVEGTYTIPDTTGISYLLDGKAVAAGSHDGPASGTITAVALTGYTLSTAEWSYPLTLDAATICEPEAPIVVIPVAPTTDPAGTCEVDGTYTIASTTGIEYLLDGTVVAAGTYTGPESGTVTARALTGYQLSDPEWSAALSLTAATTCPASVLPQTGPTGSTAGLATGGALALLIGFALIAVTTRRPAADLR